MAPPGGVPQRPGETDQHFQRRLVKVARSRYRREQSRQKGQLSQPAQPWNEQTLLTSTRTWRVQGAGQPQQASASRLPDHAVYQPGPSAHVPFQAASYPIQGGGYGQQQQSKVAWQDLKWEPPYVPPTPPRSQQRRQPIASPHQPGNTSSNLDRGTPQRQIDPTRPDFSRLEAYGTPRADPAYYYLN